MPSGATLYYQPIAPIDCTAEEIPNVRQQFYEQNQLIDETTQQVWLKQHGMSLEFLETVFIPRLLKIEKFKHQTWHHKLESYFLQSKRSLDRVIYSLIRVKDAEIARELYFRIQEKEQSFAELAREYSQCPEAQVNGIVGPAELGTIDPNLAHLFVGHQRARSALASYPCRRMAGDRQIRNIDSGSVRFSDASTFAARIV